MGIREITQAIGVVAALVTASVACAGDLVEMTESAHLSPPEAAAGDWFGSSLAVSGDTAIIGAPGDDGSAGTNQGSAYVYARTGTLWVEQAKLTASDASVGAQFGVSVGIDGDTIIVGAHQAGTGGAAYIFIRSSGRWIEQQRLTGLDTAADDYFGFSVAVHGDTAIVGAFNHGGPESHTQGAAYIFIRSGTAWTQQTELLADDAQYDDAFGWSVAVQGDTAAVGARSDDVDGAADEGSAYVFVRSGGRWAQQAHLTGADVAANDHFGNAVAIDGATLIVGASHLDCPDGQGLGAAYVFTRFGSTWTQQEKLTASDGLAGDYFGVSVALDGNEAAVGSYFDAGPAGIQQGSAYRFRRVAGDWSQIAKLTAASPEANEHFGTAVGIVGDVALVGAPNADEEKSADEGSAFLFNGDPPPIGDLTGDHVVNSIDLGILLAFWSQPGLFPAADLNHDGQINTLDLGILLSHWTL